MGLTIEAIIVVSLIAVVYKIIGDKVCGYRRKWPWEK